MMRSRSLASRTIRRRASLLLLLVLLSATSSAATTAEDVRRDSSRLPYSDAIEQGCTKASGESPITSRGPAKVVNGKVDSNCQQKPPNSLRLFTIAAVGFLAGGALTISDPLASALLSAM
eukprot:TRINITY_DN4599_c0_g1_i1.p1 TRINITY_DN4599_c0_g1~~TRINITY_DN4599_c0_g1_i1.p1  ORF type:complete len:120 (-),score=16.42 TRINITY_DN4599_c0_g1_i1:188-547(-)